MTCIHAAHHLFAIAMTWPPADQTKQDCAVARMHPAPARFFRAQETREWPHMSRATALMKWRQMCNCHKATRPPADTSRPDCNQFTANGGLGGPRIRRMYGGRGGQSGPVAPIGLHSFTVCPRHPHVPVVSRTAHSPITAWKSTPPHRWLLSPRSLARRSRTSPR